MDKQTYMLIEFVKTIPGFKVTHHPRKNDYEVTFKSGKRYVSGWAVLSQMKFFYETMKLKKFDMYDYSFQVLGKSLVFPIK